VRALSSVAVRRCRHRGALRNADETAQVRRSGPPPGAGALPPYQVDPEVERLVDVLVWHEGTCEATSSMSMSSRSSSRTRYQGREHFAAAGRRRPAACPHGCARPWCPAPQREVAAWRPVRDALHRHHRAQGLAPGLDSELERSPIGGSSEGPREKHLSRCACGSAGLVSGGKPTRSMSARSGGAVRCQMLHLWFTPVGAGAVVAPGQPDALREKASHSPVPPVRAA
jgi:hypothetical protein